MKFHLGILPKILAEGYTASNLIMCIMIDYPKIKIRVEKITRAIPKIKGKGMEGLIFVSSA